MVDEPAQLADQTLALRVAGPCLDRRQRRIDRQVGFGRAQRLVAACLLQATSTKAAETRVRTGARLAARALGAKPCLDVQQEGRDVLDETRDLLPDLGLLRAATAPRTQPMRAHVQHSGHPRDSDRENGRT